MVSHVYHDAYSFFFFLKLGLSRFWSYNNYYDSNKNNNNNNNVVVVTDAVTLVLCNYHCHDIYIITIMEVEGCPSGGNTPTMAQSAPSIGGDGRWFPWSSPLSPLSLLSVFVVIIIIDIGRVVYYYCYSHLLIVATYCHQYHCDHTIHDLIPHFFAMVGLSENGLPNPVRPVVV